MNGEDYNLNLGEVESPQQDQQQVPGIALDEYLKRLRSLGFDDTDAVGIMSRNGYNSQEVYNEMVSQYETQREEYLRKKEEAEQRAKESEERAAAMSSEKKKSDRFDSSGKPSTGELTDEQLLDTFVPSRATKQQFDDPSQVEARGAIDQSKYKQIFEENPELSNPYSAVALPDDLVSAMQAGEDVGLRYQSYKNDGNLFDNYTAKRGVAAINDAIKRGDVRAYKALAEDMAELGYNYPPIEEFGADSAAKASSYSVLAFDALEKQSKSLMEERNIINDQYGLASNFNPESDVDFVFALKESISRQQADIDSSELASYQERIEEEADKLPPGFMGESIVRGFVNGAVKSVVDAAKYSLPAMYYEATGDNEKYNAYMSANRRSQDIMAQDKRNRFKERFNLSEDVADMGVSEATEMWLNGELSQEDYHSKILYESGEFFGGALSYMIPIGRVSKALTLAKGAVAKTAAKGAGALTAEAALAAKTADAALRVARINNAGVFTALGVTSGAATYADLYDRKDLTFSEKMLQSTLVGVAEATLGKMFSNVDQLLVSGAARTVRAKTTQEFTKMAKERLASMTRRKAIGQGLKQTGRGLTEEFLEEFGVEVVAQGAEILNDIAMGRTPKEIDWYALIDAGMAGLIGAGPTSAMAGLGSYQAHSSLLKRRKVLADQIGELDAAIGQAETADERKRLTQIKEGVSAELMVIDGESRAAFDNLSEGQRRRLLKIHRDMAYTENALRRKDLSKEEKEQLTTRYESLLRAKTDIENSGQKPNLSRDDDSEPAQDATGKDVDIKGEDTTREDDVKAESAEPATEEAPEQQRQEAVQLSLFDETQEQEEAPAEEAPVAEAPAAEAPVTEEAPAEEAPAEEAPKTEPAPAEGVQTFADMGGDLVDVTDANAVGEGAGKMSLEAAIAVNRMSKAFGGALKQAGYTFKLYSREAFEATLPDSVPDKKKVGGYVDPKAKTINIPMDATSAEVLEEFGHAALRDIIGKDAKARKDIYNTLKSIARKNSGLQQILDETRANEVYSRQGEATIEEESIIAALIAYAAEPEALGSGGFVSKMVTAINKVFARILGKDVTVIENEQRFYEFARKFAAATRGEQVEITDPGLQAQEQDLRKRPGESEEQHRERLARAAEQMDPMTEEERTQQEFEERGEDISGFQFAYGKRKTEFTYLKDTEVYYTEDAYVEIGQTYQDERFQREKKIKVNDYFHFRNWYNHMTANGRRPARVTKMYFIKDGKKYTIKPPKPKTDRDGNVLRMDGAKGGRAASYDRSQKRRAEKSQAVREARARVFDLSRNAEALERAGIDPASGMALVPGFNMEEYSQIQDKDEKYNYMSEFRDDMLFSRTAEEQAEVLEIAYENLELLLQSGMSVSEIEAADKSALLNMSGRKPSFMQAEGGTTDSGDLRFAYNKKNMPASLKKRGLDLGIRVAKFAEFVGARSVNSGYDRSYESVNSGVLEQAGKEIDGNPVFLSHRTAGMAQNKYNELVKEARRDLRRPVKDRKGFVVVTHSVLDIGSIAGNPSIFADLVDRLVNDPSFTDAEVIDAVNDFISGAESPMAQKNYRKLTRSNEFNRKNSLLEALSRAGTGRIRIESIQEAKDFVDVFKQVDEALGIEQNFVDRNAFGRRIVKQILKKEGKATGARETNKYLEENFEDKGLSDQATKYVIAATKIPYAVEGRDENGEPIIGGFKRVYDDSADTPFPHAIVSTSSDFEGMALIEDQPSLRNAYSKAMVTIRDTKGKVVGTEKAFRVQKKGESKQDYIKYLRERQDFLSRSGVASELSDDKVYSYGKRGGESFSMKEETSFQKWKNLWVRRLQDKYVDIFNIQESIERQKGRVGRDQDFKMAEELMYGKAAEDLARLDKRVEEITGLMKKAGIKVDEVSRYLYALHAKERNAVISERSNGAVKDGSGISDAEADAIISAANKKALDPIVSKIREIQQDTRNTMVKYGLETKETVDAFEEMFENYVPLAGLSVDEELSSPYPTGGAGLNVFGPTTRRATGRKTEAENILAQVVAQNASIHIKARTNEALNALYNLVKENPNSKIWRLVDGKAGIDPNDPRVVAVRVDGEQKYIMFKDASYAQNLRGMNLPQTNAFIRALRIPAQWLRRSFTTLNPEFVISNFSRDIQAAIFNAAAEADIEGGMLNSKAAIGRMMKLVPQTLKTLVKNSVQKGGDPAIEKYFQEFKDDGGKTGWAYARSLDQIASDLEGAAEDKTRTQEILGKAKNFAETIEGVNDAFENSIRLAAYIAARENGVTREKAAQMAKNITVNFNKQGEWGPALNAVYLFFNASIQGTARLGRSLATLKPSKRPDGTDRTAVERVNTAQWMAGGLMIFNAMLTTLGYAMSDEDEDGVPFWDKIPDYVKERNLVIMRPNGKDYFKIPMPYGFNVFANMGTALVEGSRGAKEPTEAMMFLFNSFMASFSPVSFGQSKDLFVAAGKGAVPTVMKPFVDIMVNETYFGGPVTGENLPFGVQRPESELSFRSPESVKDFFKWMNDATGGSQYKSGTVDINPDKFWYMFEYFIGGAGQFVNRSIALPRDMAIKLFGNSELDVDANQIPLARILYGEPSKYYDYEKFKESEQEFKSLYKELGSAPQKGDAARYKGITEGSNKTLNEVRKMLKQLRAAEQQARMIPDYTDRMIRVQEIRDKQRLLVMRWNKYYEQVRD